MSASSVAAWAMRLAPRGQLATRAFMSTSVGATESPCSRIPAPLPGVYREPTELWHSDNNNGEGSSAVQKWVWDNRQFRLASPPPPPKTMADEAELTELIASAKPDSLVVVKYHAIRCDASKAIEGKFEETAAEFGDMNGQGEVHFADVSFDSNRQLCEKMGISSVPHVQIFSGYNGKIADFSIAPLKYNTLTSLLNERRDATRPGKMM